MRHSNLNLLLLVFLCSCSMVSAQTDTVKADFTNSIGMKFNLIPSGLFWMGGEAANELPLHQVKISKSFYIGIYEVTQEEYEKVMGRKPSRNTGSVYPVGATWNEVYEFCEKLSELTGDSYRLPTEAEWEYAARGGLDRKTFVWGDNPIPMIDEIKYANIPDESVKREFPDVRTVAGYDDGYVEMSPVGSFAPNGYGLYDMCGNAWERCADWYEEDYYSYSPSVDPKGPAGGEKKVLRGGGYFYSPIEKLKVAYRCGSPLDRGGSNDGFRIVKEISSDIQ